MTDAAVCGLEPTLLAKAEANEVFPMLPMQCRAARALLGWTQGELSHHAGISGATIRAFETEHTSPNPATLVVLQMALEKAGVEFTNGDHPGVRMKRLPRKGRAKE